MNRKFLGLFIAMMPLVFTGCQNPTTDTPSDTPTVITLLAIPGVTAPAQGATPVTAAIDTVQYSGTITWSPTTSIFAATTVYTANLALTAKAGWTLTGVAANGFTVAGATATNVVDSGTVAAVFPATVAGKIAVTSVALDAATATLEGGATKQLAVTVSPSDATDQAVIWTSSSSSVATVSAAGLITAVAAGSATITVTSADGAKTATCIVSVPYHIGNTGPAGGIVFYDAGNYTTYGWRYLECAPSDQSTAMLWDNGIYPVISTDTEIGTGKANTTAIVAGQGAGTYAASVCKNLTIGGYSDWFLPSKYELSLMYANLCAASPSLGSFASSLYWSSAQFGSGAAWYVNFNTGSMGYNNTYYTAYVRAIRSF